MLHVMVYHVKADDIVTCDLCTALFSVPMHRHMHQPHFCTFLVYLLST